MSDPSAYEDEMIGLFGPSDEDVERLIAGETPSDDGLTDVGDVLARARAALVEAPPGPVEVRHMAAITEAARSLVEERESAPAPAATRSVRPHRSRREVTMRSRLIRTTVQVAAAAVLLVGLSGGLAVAGVDLPGTAAETAFQKILGVDLPNQGQQVDAAEAPDPEQLPDDASETAGRVLWVVHEWLTGEGEWSGCEFGAQLAAAARNVEVDTSHCPDGDTAGAAPQGSKATGDEASGGTSTGAGQQGSKATGDEASGGASEGAPGAAGTSVPPVEVPDGQETADAARPEVADRP